MAESNHWEYRVESVGSFWHTMKDDELKALLDAWSEEGWEIVSVNPSYNTTKVRLIARRPQSLADRHRRSWPGE